MCCLQLSCTCCGQGVLRTTVVRYQKSTGTSNRPPSSMIYWIYTWDMCCTTRFICTRVTSRILWGGRHGKSSHCTTIWRTGQFSFGFPQRDLPTRSHKYHLAKMMPLRDLWNMLLASYVWKFEATSFWKKLVRLWPGRHKLLWRHMKSRYLSMMLTSGCWKLLPISNRSLWKQNTLTWRGFIHLKRKSWCCRHLCCIEWC